MHPKHVSIDIKLWARLATDDGVDDDNNDNEENDDDNEREWLSLRTDKVHLV